MPTPPYIGSGTLNEVFGAAEPYLEVTAEGESITFRCTIVEGTFCWFGEGTDEGALTSDLARQVVDQIGPRAIENAARNEVRVRCTRASAGEAGSCEIDWGRGAGWEALPSD